MKYALIADIHGNLPALEAVLKDAAAQGADGYWLAGDYIISAPWPEETADRLMGLKNARMICGNEERYLHVPDGDDGQFAVSRFCRDALGPDRIAFFDALPDKAEFDACGVRVHMAHSSEAFIGDAETGPFSTAKLPIRYGDRPVPKEERLGDIRNALALDPRIAALRPGIYIFGHTHNQWHARFGDVLLVNPGSCGLPLDMGEGGAAYSLLTIENGRAEVEERRAEYDVEAVIAHAKTTPMYAAACVWCEVIFREWRMRRENIMYFLRYAERFAQRTGDSRRPFAKDTWEHAFAAWTAEGCPIVPAQEN